MASIQVALEQLRQFDVSRWPSREATSSVRVLVTVSKKCAVTRVFMGSQPEAAFSQWVCNWNDHGGTEFERVVDIVVKTKYPAGCRYSGRAEAVSQRQLIPLITFDNYRSKQVLSLGALAQPDILQVAEVLFPILADKRLCNPEIKLHHTADGPIDSTAAKLMLPPEHRCCGGGGAHPVSRCPHYWSCTSCSNYIPPKEPDPVFKAVTTERIFTYGPVDYSSHSEGWW